MDLSPNMVIFNGTCFFPFRRRFGGAGCAGDWSERRGTGRRTVGTSCMGGGHGTCPDPSTREIQVYCIVLHIGGMCELSEYFLLALIAGARLIEHSARAVLTVAGVMLAGTLTPCPFT